MGDGRVRTGREWPHPGPGAPADSLLSLEDVRLKLWAQAQRRLATFQALPPQCLSGGRRGESRENVERKGWRARRGGGPGQQRRAVAGGQAVRGAAGEGPLRRSWGPQAWGAPCVWPAPTASSAASSAPAGTSRSTSCTRASCQTPRTCFWGRASSQDSPTPSSSESGLLWPHRGRRVGFLGPKPTASPPSLLPARGHRGPGESLQASLPLRHLPQIPAPQSPSCLLPSLPASCRPWEAGLCLTSAQSHRTPRGFLTEPCVGASPTPLVCCSESWRALPSPEPGGCRCVGGTCHSASRCALDQPAWGWDCPLPPLYAHSLTKVGTQGGRERRPPCTSRSDPSSQDTLCR